MRGQNVLLVIDDVWDQHHESALNCIDTAHTASRTVLTTRVRELLAKCPRIDLSLPSEEEAIQLLLAAAGVPEGKAPKEAPEVVRLCGRLPLAVNMAGKLIGDLALADGNWAGLPEMLQQELTQSANIRRSDGASCTIEEHIIAASLRGIPGKDNSQIQRVLYTFALVPEDTWVPPDAFLLMMSAVGEPGAPPVQPLQLRRWLQSLIDRSLVLGTADRPQLHDIVLAFVVGQQNSDKMRAMHRKIVEAMRAARPEIPGRHGLPGWSRQDRREISRYVNKNVLTHIAVATQGAAEVDATAMVRVWLEDYPVDAISFGTFKLLGKAKVAALALEDEAAGRWWQACIKHHFDPAAMVPPPSRAGTHVGPAPTAPWTRLTALRAHPTAGQEVRGVPEGGRSCAAGGGDEDPPPLLRVLPHPGLRPPGLPSGRQQEALRGLPHAVGPRPPPGRSASSAEPGVRADAGCSRCSRRAPSWTSRRPPTSMPRRRATAASTTTSSSAARAGPPATWTAATALPSSGCDRRSRTASSSSPRTRR
jgi:hypothetical protein